MGYWVIVGTFAMAIKSENLVRKSRNLTHNARNPKKNTPLRNLFSFPLMRAFFETHWFDVNNEPMFLNLAKPIKRRHFYNSIILNLQV